MGTSMTMMSAPTSGLVGKWDLNGNANDMSGYGNNGTATNVTWVNDLNNSVVANL